MLNLITYLIIKFNIVKFNIILCYIVGLQNPLQLNFFDLFVFLILAFLFIFFFSFPSYISSIVPKKNLGRRSFFSEI